jgi:hypothetical protein
MKMSVKKGRQMSLVWGPVPRLFALNPDEAGANLSGNPARAHKDLQRILTRFLMVENIPPNLAFDFILGPR